MQPEPRYCYRHPDRETGLSCSECDRPICYECMTPAPVGLRCPEHSGKPQGIKKVTTVAERAVTGQGARSAYLVTTVLIGINVAVYLAELALGGSSDGTNNSIYDHGVLIANASYSNNTLAGVANGEWWRLITSAFLHFGILHLAVNMFSLYMGGRILEQVIGRWKFLLLYVAAALAGSAGALWMIPDVPSAGASGAIFGVFGALLVLEQRKIILSGGQILLMIVINLVITLTIPGISIGAHLGGLVAGIVLMLAYLQFRRSPQLAVLSAVGVAVASIVVAYSVI